MSDPLPPSPPAPTPPPPHRPRDDGEEKTPFQQLGRMSSMGLELAVGIVVFGAFGYGLDWLLGTKPWLVVGGLIFGLIAGLYRFIREASGMVKGPSD